MTHYHAKLLAMFSNLKLMIVAVVCNFNV